MDSELRTKILNDIEKTGFVTELRAFSTLMSHGWSCEHSTTFEDKDENCSREIDIVATKTEFIEDIGLQVVMHLVVEVKKANRPWIIFTTQPDLHTVGWRILSKAQNLYYSKENTLVPILNIDCIESGNPRELRSRVGKAFHELEKEHKEKSQIYSALISASKAAYYFSVRYGFEERKEFMPFQRSQIEIFIPVVLMNGKLVEVYSNSDHEIEVIEQKYIPVELRYSSPSYRKGDWDIEFFPDVVTHDYFKEYLETMEGWRSTIVEKVSALLKAHGKKPYVRSDQ
jgi:hypothetical protein